jgi:hypothetical protein
VAKQRSTFGKLERERTKQAKAKAKQERRANRDVTDGPDTGVTTPPREDESEILNKLAQLQTAFDDGRLSLDDFETQRDNLRDRLTID